MKNGKELGRTNSALLATGEAKKVSAQARLSTDSADTLALLEQSHLTMVELTLALAASEKHLSIAHKELDALSLANIQLRRKLQGMEKKATLANHLAFHDPLTGLPNRRLLLDRLSQAIAQASRQKKSVALVFFDLNGFKAINDRLGHNNGDKLLRRVAQRLCACLRAADTACRYGGDEFIVLLPEIEGEQSTAVVQQKIRAQLASPYRLNGKRISVSFSMGSAVYPVDAKDRKDLIRLADRAMYNAKGNNSDTPLRYALTALSDTKVSNEV